MQTWFSGFGVTRIRATFTIQVHGFHNHSQWSSLESTRYHRACTAARKDCADLLVGAGSREKCRVLLKCFDNAPGSACPNFKELDEDGQDKVGAWQKKPDLDGGASEADSM
jgi:hypothetical protein